MYYSIGCFACGRPHVPNLYRAYLHHSTGELRRDDLFAPLLKSGGYPHSFAADWERGELWVAICVGGYCGGESEPSPVAVERLFRSRDGGVTWERMDDLLPDTFLYGAFESDVLVGAGGLVADASYRLAVAGRAVSQPPGGIFSPVVVPGRGLVWWGTTPKGTLDAAFYDTSGKLLFRIDTPSPESVRYIAKTRFGNLFQWYADADGADVRFGFFDDAGRARPPWSWAESGQVGVSAAYHWFRIEGQLTEDTVYATVMTPGFFEFGADSQGLPSPETRAWPIEIALVKLDTGTVHPMLRYYVFPDEATATPFVVHMDAGQVRRVVTGRDCLNVREGPGTGSKSIACVADGVLLRARSEPVRTEGGITWFSVLTPDGQAGWVSGEFLE